MADSSELIQSHGILIAFCIGLVLKIMFLDYSWKVKQIMKLSSVLTRVSGCKISIHSYQIPFLILAVVTLKNANVVRVNVPCYITFS